MKDMSSDDDSDDDERSPSSDDDDSEEEEGEELSTSRLLARRRSTKAREKVLKQNPSGASFAKLLQLAKPDSRWILFGLLSLLVRLPFSVSMPHFVAMSVGAVVDGNQQKFMKNVE